MQPTLPPVEIRIEKLTKSFPGLVVLDAIDLTVYRGDMIAIVGGSGCGKTVLLNHILGLLMPDSGSIAVADHDSAGAPLRALAGLSPEQVDRVHRHWGVVFQRNALFSGTVFENIALWLREVRGDDDASIRAIARSALEQVGLPGDDDFLDRRQEALSGGMAKRLAVARAVATAPIVMFYDEPTTGLDPTSANQIHALIQATHEQRVGDGMRRTTVIITHDKDLLVRLRPRVVMLHQGKVHFDGTFEAFSAARSEIIRPYFEAMPLLHQRPSAG